MFGGAMPGACLYAPGLSVQSRFIRPRCRAFVNALVHALKWLQTASPTDLRACGAAVLSFGRPRALHGGFHKVRETLSTA